MPKVTLKHPINSDFSCSVEHAKKILNRPRNGGGWEPKTRKDSELLGLVKPAKKVKKDGIRKESDSGNNKTSTEKQNEKPSD
jgi:hypothetical protein